jgi:hypothetical protein
MRTTRIITVPLAALLTAAAAAGPAAAVPADLGLTPPTPQHIVQPVPTVDAEPSGFDWGSAGIGAAAAGGLVVVVAVSGFGAARRARPRLAR